eukprot:TRINITY_DN10876_c0_g2_i1.p1 TRINITY_DN10876_c0_g2~~TRINITY_DN10876_c0_g2_i1.p1  ORF type:complete len:344 (+),score=29.25 TRINITY_DN10876_c0_g2_i1:115-1146(+)
MNRKSVAIIGAGISGLVCARSLCATSSVVVFEKSPVCGGRAATTVFNRDNLHMQFDHGAQYFTARDPGFRAEVEQWIQRGCAQLWLGRIGVADNGSFTATERDVERFVGVDRMSAIGEYLGQQGGFEIHKDAEIADIVRVSSDSEERPRWSLRSALGESCGEFDIVLVAAPAPQTAALLRSVAPELADRAALASFSPSWGLLLAFERPLELPFDGAFVHNSTLSWICRNSSKPGRLAQPDCWTVHGNASWSADNAGIQPQEAEQALRNAFSKATGIDLTLTPSLLSEAVFWPHALGKPLPEPCLFSGALGIGACGDWLGEAAIQGAYLSGKALAARVSAALGS